MRICWQQIIGYIQRHLPACYSQAFAQGIYDIVDGKEQLKRDFEFRYNKRFYMRSGGGDLNNLGYKWAVGSRYAFMCGVCGFGAPLFFKNYCEQKKSGLENLFYAQSGKQQLPVELVRNRVR